MPENNIRNKLRKPSALSLDFKETSPRKSKSLLRDLDSCLVASWHEVPALLRLSRSEVSPSVAKLHLQSSDLPEEKVQYCSKQNLVCVLLHF